MNTSWAIGGAVFASFPTDAFQLARAKPKRNQSSPGWLLLRLSYPTLVEFCQFNSSVVSLQNLFRAEALPGQTVGADLAHAYAVAPAAAGEDESRDAIAGAVDAIENEELFAQTQRRTNSSTANVRRALGAYDFEIDHAS